MHSSFPALAPRNVMRPESATGSTSLLYRLWHILLVTPMSDAVALVQGIILSECRTVCLSPEEISRR